MSFMSGRADQDPYAVMTHMVAGEEVAFSSPWVTDAERAAAGRETLAERTRELLAANRERAAARYTGGGLPDDAEMARVWCRRDPADLGGRLGAERLAVWADGDVLHVLWRGEADRVLLGGGVSAPLWPVEGGGDLWEASLRIRRLDEAVITVLVVALGAADLPFGRPVTDQLTWRGPGAPGAPGAPDDSEEWRPLAGELREHVLESAAVHASRSVTVYVPPADVVAGPLPGCVLADGESTRGFAQVLEPAIVSGAVPPVVLVGVHNGHDPSGRSDVRSQEYLPRVRPRRFAAHLSFVTGEVIPWAGGEFPVLTAGPAGERGPWISAGFSNGAAWAIAAAQRRPEVFGGVAALSAGIVPSRVAGPSRVVRHYLAAGTLEPGFRRATREWAERLGRAGVPYHHREWAGGHDPFWWQHCLPEALAWLLG
jgi:enterochelin esterase-like enzyme